jgi:uncharacterized protein (DUF58 family)
MLASPPQPPASGTEKPSAAATEQPPAIGLAWHVSVKVVTEGIVAALALLAAAVTGDVALVAFATPLAIACVFAVARTRPVAPSVELVVTPIVSGPAQAIEVRLTLRATTTCFCRLTLVLPPGLASDDAVTWTVLVRRGRAETLACTLRAARAGRFALGNLLVRVTDSSSALVGRGAATNVVTIESRPAPLALKTLVRPERVRATAGDRVARQPADGIEFAEVREEMVGALERRINWRATARRGTTCINVHHPERSTDIVLLADTFNDAALPSVVAVAVSLADTYLRRHDRLGLVAFGGVLDWVEPGTGPSHFERIRRALLSSETYFSYAWKTADVIPRRLFPAGCLVLAVTPLGDPRFVATLASLRSRGIELAIVEVEPPWPDGSFASEAGALARRIVTMERSEQRRRFWHLGVPVATLEGPDGIAAALAEIAAFRRSMRGRIGSGAAVGGRR